MQRREDLPPNQPRRSTLPALAPRSPQATSTRVRPSSSTAPRRTPRLSHRSRDGCWTCRARKVKCDEQQPTCGPCARLSRECDWGQRWNFNDATSGTKARHTNVSTEGSVVWDPAAAAARATSSDPESATTSRSDDLPDFAALTNDSDRERKAITRRPGTYAVVVTPGSFAELPEYSSSASTTESMQMSRRGSKATITSADRRLQDSDPDTIVLEKFEDVAPGLAGPFSLEPFARRASLPKALQNMTIMSVPPTPSFRTPTFPSPVRADMSPAESRLVIHFRTYIMQLLQPQVLDSQGPLQWGQLVGNNIYEQEAVRFPPLHHAICAVSALNLSTRGQATLEEAIQHYQKALDSQSSASSNDMILSDGVFLRHYLLFIYDICADSSADDDTAMWAKHLYSLRHLARSRFQQSGREAHTYVISSICSLDVYAGLMGNGSCDFNRTVLEDNMLAPLGAELDKIASSQSVISSYHETQTWQAVLNIHRGIRVHASNVAQAAQTYRAEVGRQRHPTSPGFAAHWQAVIARLEHELIAFWNQAYPQFLARDSPHAGQALVPAMRLVFEHALTFYHACILYLRTLLPPSHANPVNPQLRPDSAYRISVIFTLAALYLQQQDFSRREIIFPVFVAGLAATSAEDQIRAVDFLAQFQGHGIGRNTSVAKQLLSEVCEEQRRGIARGESGWVDWVALGRARGLAVVVCGL